jgi:succinylarginine dihydrolase
LRVVLTEAEIAALGAGVILDEAKVDALEDVVRRNYRDRVELKDLVDPALLRESRTALDEIGQVLGLGAVHDFQHA